MNTVTSKLIKAVVVSAVKEDTTSKALFIDLIEQLGTDKVINKEVVHQAYLKAMVYAKDEYTLADKVKTIGNLAIKWKEANLKYKPQLMRWYNIKDIISLLYHFYKDDNSNLKKVKERVYNLYDRELSEAEYNNTIKEEIVSIRKEYKLFDVDGTIKRLDTQLDNLINGLTPTERAKVLSMLLTKVEALESSSSSNTVEVA